MIKKQMRLLRVFCLVLAAAVVLSACLPKSATPGQPPVVEATTPAPAAPATDTPLPPTEAAPPTETAQPALSAPWWREAAVYEVFVRSYQDSNGDGVGDFNGLAQKLDYLESLGVSALWLMPIYPTGTYHGYDVQDYYAVNPEYGTMEEFKALLEAAHQRDMRIIIDFVMNHTSNENPWFKASAAGDSAYADWYIWQDTDPGYAGPWGQRVWHEQGGRYYYGVFDSIMPDLNYRSEAVTQEMYKVADFWLKDVGVDGFRVDGAKHLIEKDKLQEDTPETKEWLKGFLAHVKQTQPEAFVVGEVWSPTILSSAYVKREALDMVFNFQLAENVLAGVGFGYADRIERELVASAKAFPENRYGFFLANHDQTRVMTKMMGDVNRAKAAAAVMLTGPGTPFIYYGEEIGMSGDKPDPQIRTPMQWSAEAGAGFTTGTPWEAVNEDYTTINAAAQQDDPDSLLNRYRDLLKVRNENAVLRTGSYTAGSATSKQVLASLRVLGDGSSPGDEVVLVLINVSDQPVKDFTIGWKESGLRGRYTPTLLYGEGEVAPLDADEGGAVRLYAPVKEIEGYGVLVVKMGK